jgi:glucose/mannose-6-phosphate isomerase
MPDLDTLARTLDRSNMKAVIEGVPEQIRAALAQPLPPIPTGRFTGAIIVGMGGSALPADVVVSAFGERLLGPLAIVRHYNLPAVDDRTLVIASSFSGSTEETLSAIEGLRRHSTNVVVVTAGGQLQTLADQRDFALIRIPVEREPRGFQPRSAVGYFITYFARVLAAAGLMPDADAELEAVVSFLGGIQVRPQAEEIAIWLKDRIPVVYTDERHLLSIARITKIKFNENAKRPAFFNALPEANHNEMIGYVKPLAQVGALYLHDESSHPRIRQRFQVMAETFRRDRLDHVDFREWAMPGSTLLERTFAALVFAEWCSYTLALLDGFDPTPVDLVERFKTALVSSSSVVRSP